MFMKILKLLASGFKTYEKELEDQLLIMKI